MSIGQRSWIFSKSRFSLHRRPATERNLDALVPIHRSPTATTMKAANLSFRRRRTMKPNWERSIPMAKMNETRRKSFELVTAEQPAIRQRTVEVRSSSSRNPWDLKRLFKHLPFVIAFPYVRFLRLSFDRFALQVSQLKRLNNLQNDQDFYALKYCRVPVRRFGILHEGEASSATIVNLSDQITSDSFPVTHLTQQNPHAFLNAMDQDLAMMRTKVEQLIETPSATALIPHPTSTQMITRSSPKVRSELNCDGADCGCKLWHIILVIVLIALLVPFVYIYLYLHPPPEANDHHSIWVGLRCEIFFLFFSFLFLAATELFFRWIFRDKIQSFNAYTSLQRQTLIDDHPRMILLFREENISNNYREQGWSSLLNNSDTGYCHIHMA